MSGTGTLGVAVGVFLTGCLVGSGHLVDDWSCDRETFLFQFHGSFWCFPVRRGR